MFILRLINVVPILLIGTIAHGGNVDEAQRLLNKLGYDAGVVDGLYGSKTRSALVEFYSDKPEKFDGHLSTNEILDLASQAQETISLQTALMLEPAAALKTKKHSRYSKMHANVSNCMQGKSKAWQLEKFPLKLKEYDFVNEFRSPFSGLDNKLCEKGFVQVFGFPISIEKTIPIVIDGGTSKQYGNVPIDVANATAWWSIATSHAVYDPKSKASQKVKDTLLKWAEEDALSKNIITSYKTVDFQIAVILSHIVESVAALGPEINEEERKIIGPWLNGLIIKLATSDWGGRQDNKQYLSDYIQSVWGYTNGDDDIILDLAENYKLAIHDMRNDGSIVYESIRGGTSLTYQVHALARLTKQAALIKAITGVDIAQYSAEGKRSIADGLKSALQNHYDPLKRVKLYGKSCPGGSMGSLSKPHTGGDKMYLKPILEFVSVAYPELKEMTDPNQIRGNGDYHSVGNIQCLFTAK